MSDNGHISADWAQGRKRAIYLLFAVCLGFFGFWIAFNFAQAAYYGYGSGFGDGYVETKALIPPTGNGWLIDSLVLAATVVFDVGLLFAFRWLLPKLDDPTPDEPTAPLPAALAADLSDESWYIVPVPRLAKVMTAMAIACTVWLSVCIAAVLPVVLIRYGWS